MISSGEQPRGGGGARRRRRSLLARAVVRKAPEERKRISPLDYLLAQHLVISARFHAQMEALLSPHGEYRAARMHEERHPVRCQDRRRRRLWPESARGRGARGAPPAVPPPQGRAALHAGAGRPRGARQGARGAAGQAHAGGHQGPPAAAAARRAADGVVRGPRRRGAVPLCRRCAAPAQRARAPRLCPPTPRLPPRRRRHPSHPRTQ